MILARHFGRDSVGQYVFALAFTTIFSILVDFGLTPVLIREAARKFYDTRKLFCTVLVMKSIFAVCALALLAFVVSVHEPAHAIWPLIASAGAVMLIDSFHLTAYGVLRSVQMLFVESVGIVVSQIATLIMGVFIVALDLPIQSAIIGLSLGSALHATIAVITLMKKRLLPRGLLLLQDMKAVLRQAIPFGLAGLFARGYSYIDSIIIGSFLTFGATGLYGAAVKLTFAFQFIPLALTAAAYPALSENLRDCHAHAAELVYRCERYLLMVAIPIAGALILFASDVLALFGAEFTAARTSLIVLALSLVFSFVSYPVGAYLNAARLQHLQTVAMGFTLALNAALNFALIPAIGIFGAAVSAFIGNVCLFLFGAFFVSRSHLPNLQWKKIARDAAQLFFLFAPTVLFIVFTRSTKIGREVPWFITGIAGAVLYVILLVRTGFVEWNEITSLVKRKI